MVPFPPGVGVPALSGRRCRSWSRRRRTRVQGDDGSRRKLFAGRPALKLGPTRDPVDAVGFLVRAAEKAAQTGDPDLADLSLCLHEYLDYGAANLDEAFGLARGPGQRDARTLVGLARRDEAVRAAYRQWGDVDALVQALARYYATGWRRDRLERQCPPRLANRPERLLYEILRWRDRCLGRSAIYEIIQNAPRFHWTGSAANSDSRSKE